MIAGAWLRLVLGGAAITAIVVTLSGVASADVRPLVVVLSVVVVGWLMVRPGSAVGLLLIGTLLLLHLVLHGSQISAELFGLVVLLPLIHLLAGVSAAAPPTSSLRWAALLPSAARYAGCVGAVCGALVLAKVSTG